MIVLFPIIVIGKTIYQYQQREAFDREMQAHNEEKKEKQFAAQRNRDILQNVISSDSITKDSCDGYNYRASYGFKQCQVTMAIKSGNNLYCSDSYLEIYDSKSTCEYLAEKTKSKELTKQICEKLSGNEQKYCYMYLGIYYQDKELCEKGYGGIYSADGDYFPIWNVCPESIGNVPIVR